MKEFGPCMCGDPACGRCGNPKQAKLDDLHCAESVCHHDDITAPYCICDCLGCLEARELEKKWQSYDAKRAADEARSDCAREDRMGEDRD